MQQIATFDTAFDNRTAADRTIQRLGGNLRRQVLGMWGCVQQASSVPMERAPVFARQGTKGYYGGAFARVQASVPVLSLREVG